MKAALIALLSCLLIVRGGTDEPARPNIIPCMTADQGWGDVSCNGLAKIQTPNMDAMAAADVPMRDYGRKEYVRVSKDLPNVESAPWRLVCTMPYNCHFQPSVEVEAETGKVIVLTPRIRSCCISRRRKA